MKKVLMILTMMMLIVVLVACDSDEPSAVEARAVFELDRVYFDDELVEVSETAYEGSRLTFVGEEQGGNVLIRVGFVDIQASINPSREHPSFDSGYWHHHLYAGSTEAGSPRINFRALLPELEIDDNEEATDDNTQSVYQRGNLHYVVEDGEFRLRLTIDGVVHDLLFREV